MILLQGLPFSCRTIKLPVVTVGNDSGQTTGWALQDDRSCTAYGPEWDLREGGWERTQISEQREGTSREWQNGWWEREHFVIGRGKYGRTGEST